MQINIVLLDKPSIITIEVKLFQSPKEPHVTPVEGQQICLLLRRYAIRMIRYQILAVNVDIFHLLCYFNYSHRETKIKTVLISYHIHINMSFYKDMSRH